jgi:hypothetical protein
MRAVLGLSSVVAEDAAGGHVCGAVLTAPMTSVFCRDRIAGC